MVVLYWSELFPPHVGGLEVFGGHFVAALAERGHRVVVVTSHSALPLPDAETRRGVTVRRFRFHAALVQRDLAGAAAVASEIARLKDTLRPDVVHLTSCGGEPSLFHHAMTLRACDAARLVAVHGAEPSAWRAGGLAGRVLTAADWVVAVSSAGLSQALRARPDLEGRTSVIHDGLPPGPAPAPARGVRRQTVIAAGRLVESKGFDVALRAFALVRAHTPGARFEIVGDGPEAPRLSRLSEDLGLRDAVEFLGMVPPDRVRDLLASAAVVAVPSVGFEAFGLVALEAAFAGRPVVASRNGGLAEVVRSGETGLLVPPADPHALAEALRRLLDLPAMADRMGAEARRRAEAEFGLERCVDAYERLYERLIAGRRRAGTAVRS